MALVKPAWYNDLQRAKWICAAKGCPLKPPLKPYRIFSGDKSSDMWDHINKAKNISELRMALYVVCCRLQEFELKLEKD